MQSPPLTYVKNEKVAATTNPDVKGMNSGPSTYGILVRSKAEAKQLIQAINNKEPSHPFKE